MSGLSANQSLEFLFNTFPMPPTSNHMYASVQGRLIKSKESREYRQRCDFWALRNIRVLNAVRDAISKTSLPHTIELDTTFCFLEARLVSKKNTIKRLDATSRIKGSHDEFCRILEIDDSIITGGRFEKVSCESSNQEGVLFKIRLSKLRKLDEIKEESARKAYELSN